MNAMRDPLVVEKQQQQHGEEEDVEASYLAPAASWTACPSLSGIAFAVVAATLPLLAGHDVRSNAGEGGTFCYSGAHHLMSSTRFLMVSRCG